MFNALLCLLNGLELPGLILSGRDGSQVFKEVGLTDYEKLGIAEGTIHSES